MKKNKSLNVNIQLMIRNTNTKICLIVIITILITSLFYTENFSCFKATNLDYWPTEEWVTAEPEEMDMDSKILLNMDKHIEKLSKNNELSLDSLLIVRNGYLVKENYYNDYNKSALHSLFSVTKSIISALVGIAVEEDYLNLSQKMIDFFPDRTIENIDERKENITIEHLLTMTSGIDWSDTLFLLWLTNENQVQYVLDRPMKNNPGEVFNYNTGSTHILSYILQNATGKSTQQYAQEKIFEPLGIKDYSWDRDNQGIYYGGHGLALNSRDLAKFGFLYLNNGTWEEQQIVSKDWVSKTTQLEIVVNNVTDYGHLWWIWTNHSAYMAIGMFGQYIIVFPEYNLVVVLTANTLAFSGELALIEDYILQSINEYPFKTTEKSILPLSFIMICCTLIYFIKKMIITK